MSHEIAPPPLPLIATQVRGVLAEDLGDGDLTASLLPETLTGTAEVITRENAVLCGAPWFDEVFRQLDSQVEVVWDAAEGDAIQVGQCLCRLQGPIRALLSGERTALNFLQTLSGTATLARRYAQAVAGTRVRILDTRKTLPGLRLAQKYAVATGGCANHRLGLYDAILIKENHIAACGGIGPALAMARCCHPHRPIEIEVEDLVGFGEALAAGATHILLDNFSHDRIREAVALNAGRARLEVSGGVAFDGLRALADTGIDDISIGALTKHLRAVDLSLRVSANAPAADVMCVSE
ncbi:MAG: carboxylating nicotinate-nucleotide diphosphorylase [Pseudomonadota bacterium]